MGCCLFWTVVKIIEVAHIVGINFDIWCDFLMYAYGHPVPNLSPNPWGGTKPLWEGCQAWKDCVNIFSHFVDILAVGNLGVDTGR
jgi:hypothetical protein